MDALVGKRELKWSKIHLCDILSCFYNIIWHLIFKMYKKVQGMDKDGPRQGKGKSALDRFKVRDGKLFR